MNRRFVSMCMAAIVMGMLVVPGVVLAKPSGRAGPAPPAAAWTYAIYMDGDNNLETYWAGTSLPMLEAVPASSSVNIVALVDLGSTTGYQLQKISGTAVTTVESGPELNMGDPASLTMLISKAASLFPSTYLAVSLWDHGYAWNYVCKDDTSGGDALSMAELQTAIANAGKRVDVLAFDCCNMGNIEVAYQVSLTGLVGYMVGSEETVPGNGFPYDLMLTPLVNNAAMLPRDFSMVMIDAWGQYYATQTWATTVNLAAIDIAQLRASMPAITTWSADMKAMLPGYRSAYATALKSAYYMWGTHYFTDQYDYGMHLLSTKGVNDAKLRADTVTMQNAVLSFCIKVWDAKRMPDCKGISLYWGTGNEWNAKAVAYNQLAFAVDSGWGAFLTTYNA